ncbi:PREDICTED: major pollen allergen Ole e 10-like [Tarenaya hassleriana]|uniref:major pollen allergen Ole e 10-like n=1 Tax=Tarenaya hassleriana TaxID=28532 RepID=UPI00053C77D6|nr:PREDICTED: major pollen allergen Ole e 10-like [Tarenaya hassleriana]
MLSGKISLKPISTFHFTKKNAGMKGSKRQLELVLLLGFAFLFCFLGVAPGSCARDEGSKANRGTDRWCIAKPASDNERLLKNIDYSCAQRGVSCRAIQPGGTCYHPNTAVSHASYAMNLFFKSAGKHTWDCHFNGTGIAVTQDPSFGVCVYPL